LVRLGRPAHNVTFADQLLRAAVDLTRQAVKAGGLAYTVPKLDLGTPADESGCASCHLGVERATVPFQGGGTFPHEPHALRAQLKCGQCHTPIDQHGGTRIANAAACQSCHHAQAKAGDCATCHRAVGTSGKGVLNVEGRAFPHAPHQRAVPTCAPCHVAPTMTVATFACSDCHQPHHARTDRACTSCHGSDVLAKHDGFAADIHAAAPPCGSCHEAAQEFTTWNRQTCTACHATKATGHYEKAAATSRGCEACHDLKAIKGNGSG
jgi:hypothetical protein